MLSTHCVYVQAHARACVCDAQTRMEVCLMWKMTWTGLNLNVLQKKQATLTATTNQYG